MTSLKTRISLPIFCAISLAILLPSFSSASPPAWGFGYGWNGGVHSNLDGGQWVVDSKVGGVYSFHLFFGSFREEERRQRWGFGVTTQRIKTIPEQGENYATNFRSTFIQLEYEHALWRGSFADLAAGLGLGFGWRSDKNENSAWNYCDSAFCNMPDYNWVLSPGVKAYVPIVGILSLTAGVEANIYSGSASATYPYKTGVSFMVGIQLWSFAGEKRPPAKSDPTLVRGR